MATIDPNKLTTTQRAQLARRAEQTGQSDQLKDVFQQRQAPRVTPASTWVWPEPQLFWEAPASPTPTPEATVTPTTQNTSIPEVNRPTDTNQASNQVIDTIAWNAVWDRTDTEQFTQSLADIQREREEINKAQQQREAEFAKQKEESIKELDNKFAEIEKQTQALIDQRLQRDVEDMKALKEAERTKLDAAWDLQRFRDEEALREARQGVLVSQMQANVAMNKLGLAFSTWAINMTQSIATNGFTAIAGLKIQANFNQANFQRDASQLEFDYSTEINRTIDKYTDQQIKLKEQTASRIFDTQNNLLLTEREKIDNINRLKEDYLNSKQATEEQIFKETQAARVRAEARAKDIQAEMLAEESRQRTEVARKIQNWSFHLLTSSQKKQLADQSNMSVEELAKIEDNFIQSQIYAMAEQIMGEDFLFTMEENIQISNTVKRLIDSGVGMEQAVDRAVADTIRKNPEYRDMLEARKQPSLEERKLALEYEKLWISQFKAETDRLKLDDWTQLYWRNTWIRAWGSFDWFPVKQVFWTKGWPNGKDTWANWGTPWVDLAMPVGTPIRSFIDWEVIFSWKNWDYWNQIQVRDSQGNIHMFSHLSSLDYPVWKTVSVWDNIWLSWNTWFSTWPHLDYRVKSWNNWVDPSVFMLTNNEMDWYNQRLEREDLVSQVVAMKDVWKSYSEKELKAMSMRDLEMVRNEKENLRVMRDIWEPLTEYISNKNKDTFQELMKEVETNWVPLSMLFRERIKPIYTHDWYQIDTNAWENDWEIVFVEWDAHAGRRIPDTWSIVYDTSTWVIWERKWRFNITAWIDQVREFGKIDPSRILNEIERDKQFRK